MQHASFKFLVVDAGNTSIKIAFFDEGLNQTKFDNCSNIYEFEKKISNIKYDFSLLASVRSEKDTNDLAKFLKNVKLFSQCILPTEINYETVSTLGVDRIANAVYVASKSKNASLIIDIGTCIKIDLINNNAFQGGSISPGIRLRYLAMYEYTGSLPLIDKKNQIDFLGKSTQKCMHSGVINGIQGEIEHFLNYYQEIYPELIVYVTGGDASYIKYSIKNIRFIPNLTLFGLYEVLKFNMK